MPHKKLINILSCISAAAIFSILIFSYYRDSLELPESFPAISETPFYKNLQEIDTSAVSAIVCDANSGEIIYSENPNEKLPMASTTKIMTALVVLENTSLDETVTISEQSVGIEGSSIYLSKGETLTVEELLYGLLLESGNDAAHALALYTGKSIDGFCLLMNEKAKALGLSSTNFENPHGLSSENHYTTARELAVITSNAMKNDTFRKIVSTTKYYIKGREGCRERYFSNHNRLLKTLHDCVGVKTGYTKNSGRCLVSATNKDDSTFITVTLNDRNDFNDHKTLHTYAHNNFKTVLIAKKEELRYSIGHDTVFNNEDIYITVKKDYEGPFSMQVDIDKNGNSDIGTVKIGFDGITRQFYLYTYDSIPNENQ
ncbi:MAG: D-alanyl-D-alanine carboxypeptidase [Ruminococcaceae bacterium]|nr:D-alanyl-D-alanine carboxypeptidase [Oscillospiraceae bacterium]